VTTSTDWTTQATGTGGYADVNGLHLYYETYGTGRPLVLLHGGLGSGGVTVLNAPGLVDAGYRVVAPDLQGHGRTADIDRPIDVRLMADDIAALIGQLGDGSTGRYQAAPLLAAARTPVVAAIAARLKRPLLLLVNNAEAALRVREDLCTWIGDDRALLFPASDAMPYEAMSPGDEVIGQRLRVLRLLGRWRPGSAHVPPLLVAPVRALLQPTLTPAELAFATTTLALGQRRGEEDLLRFLLDLGYRSAASVEAPGEISRRGGIVDVWAPGEELPLRIEFFGDEIDSLRRFDPITQRSEAQIREVVIGPPHEIALWRTAEAMERMRALDAAGLRREARDEWGAAIERIAMDNLHELTMDESAERQLDPPAANRLNEIDVPTLVIKAEHDPPFSRRTTDLIATGIPSARVVMLDADHVVNLRAPAAFDAAVLPFLAEVRP